MPSLKSIRLLLFIATLLLIGRPAFAQYYYLDIPTIRGESLSSAHPGTIESVSFSLNCTNSGAGVVFSDLTVTKFLDKASPPLFLASAQGTTLSSVILYGQKINSGGASSYDYYTIKLTNAKVSSVIQNGSSGNQADETVTFRYQRIEIDYVGQNPSNGQLLPAVVMRWDLTTNQPF
ncbi:MAG: Hcp family type VI secretion system effector [Limisphaerales bacterium]